ncbi:minor capsid protein [Clostridium culturomicium]|uniref:minor capsid protein n=1 Tax=Clostridium culturomicium TaxID=1499683 RepID=UPI00385795BD
MATTVRIKMNDTQKILLKRALNKNGEAQMRFSKECAKWMNNYIPYLHGRLKDMNVEVNRNNVTYTAPYAKKQYYLNKGNGKQGLNQGGLRGKQWDKRMWIDNGDKIVKTIAEFCGGRAK